MNRLTMGIAAAVFAASGAEAQPQRSQAPRVSPPAVYEVSPPLGTYTDEVLFGDNWRREMLSPRDRSLVTLATLITGNRVAQIRSHTVRALDNGVTPTELSELIAHLAFYAGWPVAISAVNEVKAAFDQRGITGVSLPEEQPPLILEPQAEASRRASVDIGVGDIAPG